MIFYLVLLAGQLREHADQVKALLTVPREAQNRESKRLPAKGSQPQRRLTPEQVDELVQAYRAGGTIKGLAVQFRIHHTTVMAHLDRRGVVRRRRGQVLSQEQADDAVALYQAGWSLHAVAAKIGSDHRVVRESLVKAGVEIRRAGRN